MDLCYGNMEGEETVVYRRWGACMWIWMLKRCSRNVDMGLGCDDVDPQPFPQLARGVLLSRLIIYFVPSISLTN